MLRTIEPVELVVGTSEGVGPSEDVVTEGITVAVENGRLAGVGVLVEAVACKIRQHF